MTLLVSVNPETLKFEVTPKNYNPNATNWNNSKIQPATNFMNLYNFHYGYNKNEYTSKIKFAKRKWTILRMMKKSQLIQDYGKDHNLTPDMTKAEMLMQLKRTDVRHWVYK